MANYINSDFDTFFNFYEGTTTDQSGNNRILNPIPNTLKKYISSDGEVLDFFVNNTWIRTNPNNSSRNITDGVNFPVSNNIIQARYAYRSHYINFTIIDINTIRDENGKVYNYKGGGISTNTNVTSFTQFSTIVTKNFMIAFSLYLNASSPNTEILKFYRGAIEYKVAISSSGSTIVVIVNNTYTYSFSTALLINNWNKVCFHISHAYQSDGVTITGITVRAVINTSLVAGTVRTISPALQHSTVCSCNLLSNGINGILGSFIFYSSLYSNVPESKTNPSYLITFLQPKKYIGTINVYPYDPEIGIFDITIDTNGDYTNMDDNDVITVTVTPAVTLTTTSFRWSDFKTPGSGITIVSSGETYGSTYTVKLSSPGSIITTYSYVKPRVFRGFRIIGGCPNGILLGKPYTTMLNDTDIINFSITPSSASINSRVWSQLKNGNMFLPISSGSLSIGSNTLVMEIYGSPISTVVNVTQKLIGIINVTSSTLSSVTISAPTNYCGMNNSDIVNFNILGVSGTPLIASIAWNVLLSSATTEIQLSSVILLSSQSYNLRVNSSSSSTFTTNTFVVPPKVLGTTTIVNSSPTTISIGPMIGFSGINQNDTVTFNIIGSSGSTINSLRWINIISGISLNVVGNPLLVGSTYTLEILSSSATSIRNSFVVESSRRIEDLCEQLTLNTPKSIVTCCLLDTFTNMYVRFTNNSFTLSPFYPWYDEREFLFPIVYRLGSSRTQRYVSTYSNPCNVTIDGSENVLTVQIPIDSTNNFYTVRSPNAIITTTTPSTLRFIPDLFTRDSYYYNGITNARNYTIASTGDSLKKQIIIRDASGNQIVQRQSLTYSQTITHAKLTNSTNGKPDVFIRFDNFSDNNNFFMYVVSDASITDFGLTNAQGIIDLTNTYDGASYSDCYLGWSKTPISIPLQINYVLFKNLSVRYEYILFYCVDGGNSSPGKYVKYTIDPSMTTKVLESGPYTYSYSTGIVSIQNSGGSEIKQIRFIDGMFYETSSRNAYIMMTWNTSPDTDINSIGFYRGCEFLPFVPTPLPDFVFDTQSQIRLPMINYKRDVDGTNMMIYGLQVSSDGVFSYIQPLGYGGMKVNMLQYYETDTFAFSKQHSYIRIDTNKIFKIISSNTFGIKAQYIYSNGIVRPETTNFSVYSTNPPFVTSLVEFGNMVQSLSYTPSTYTLSNGVYSDPTKTIRVLVWNDFYGLIDNLRGGGIIPYKLENNIIYRMYPDTKDANEDSYLIGNDTISFRLQPSDTTRYTLTKDNTASTISYSSASQYIDTIEIGPYEDTIYYKEHPSRYIIPSATRIGLDIYVTFDNRFLFLQSTNKANLVPPIFRGGTIRVFKRTDYIFKFVPAKIGNGTITLNILTDAQKLAPYEMYSLTLSGDTFPRFTIKCARHVFINGNYLFYITRYISSTSVYGYFHNNALIQISPVSFSPSTDYKIGNFRLITYMSSALPQAIRGANSSIVSVSETNPMSLNYETRITITGQLYIGNSPLAYWDTTYDNDWSIQVTMQGSKSTETTLGYGILILDTTNNRTIYTCGVENQTMMSTNYVGTISSIVNNRTFTDYTVPITIRLVKINDKLIYYFMDSNNRLLKHTEVVLPTLQNLRIGFFMYGNSTNFMTRFYNIIFI